MTTSAHTIQKRADLAEGIAGTVGTAVDHLVQAQAAARASRCPVLIEATTKALKEVRAARKIARHKRDQLERSLTRKTPREVTRERR